MPRRYEPRADGDLADDIKFKSLVVSEPSPKAAWQDGHVLKRAVEIADACGPLLAWRG